MYTLIFRHPKGDSVLTWELDVPYDTVLFINYDGQMAKGFTLKWSFEGLTIHHESSCLLKLSFADTKLMYLLRLIRDGDIIREFYLAEDDLADEHDFTIEYPGE